MAPPETKKKKIGFTVKEKLSKYGKKKKPTRFHFNTVSGSFKHDF